jgi:hypothetical protein
MRGRRARKPNRVGLAAVAVAAALGGHAARASEGGASFYLLGSGGPEAAILPPVSGVFFANTAFYYRGEAGGGQQFTFGGNVVAGLTGTIAADFPTVLWVPQMKVLGGTFAVGAALPFGKVWVDAQTVLTGPLGRSFAVSAGDKALVLGDPVLTAALGWSRGRTFFQLSDMLNVPVGQYRDGELANLAFHRWANDFSAAVSWHDPKAGWDISAKSGFTLNGENHATDYVTGTEWHLEGAVEKALTPAWSLGAQVYQFDQLTGDSGAGAVLGPFKGRVTGVGGSVAYNFKVGHTPLMFRLHGTAETSSQNRLLGHSIWLDFTMPLHVNMPAEAH